MALDENQCYLVVDRKSSTESNVLSNSDFALPNHLTVPLINIFKNISYSSSKLFADLRVVPLFSKSNNCPLLTWDYGKVDAGFYVHCGLPPLLLSFASDL